MVLSSPEAEVRALAKERQKKDNHNLSKYEQLKYQQAQCTHLL